MIIETKVPSWPQRYAIAIGELSYRLWKRCRFRDLTTADEHRQDELPRVQGGLDLDADIIACVSQAFWLPMVTYDHDNALVGLQGAADHRPIVLARVLAGIQLGVLFSSARPPTTTVDAKQKEGRDG